MREMLSGKRSDMKSQNFPAVVVIRAPHRTVYAHGAYSHTVYTAIVNLV